MVWKLIVIVIAIVVISAIFNFVVAMMLSTKMKVPMVLDRMANTLLIVSTVTVTTSLVIAITSFFWTVAIELWNFQ